METESRTLLFLIFLFRDHHFWRFGVLGNRAGLLAGAEVGIKAFVQRKRKRLASESFLLSNLAGRGGLRCLVFLCSTDRRGYPVLFWEMVDRFKT